MMHADNLDSTLRIPLISNDIISPGDIHSFQIVTTAFIGFARKKIHNKIEKKKKRIIRYTTERIKYCCAGEAREQVQH